MAADIRHQIILLLPRLRRFARGLTGSAAEADDLVQGACERALRAIGSWQPGTRLDSWLFRILRNLWIDDLRRRRIAVSSEGPIDPPGEDGRTVTEARIDLGRVRERIAELPPAQREVLVLVCIEDLSYREAAAVLDVPIGTIMSRLARARQALAASLGESGASAPGARGAVR
ncbi:MAG: RNA polymerase sigma factor [Bauldia sp.]|nr:RNA polymerase sigma factor [Bauldia sp.]